jgi:hypothetical protein
MGINYIPVLKLKKYQYFSPNGITILCLLDNWIYNDNTDINKQKNVCLAWRIR